MADYDLASAIWLLTSGIQHLSSHELPRHPTLDLAFRFAGFEVLAFIVGCLALDNAEFHLDAAPDKVHRQRNHRGALASGLAEQMTDLPLVSQKFSSPQRVVAITTSGVGVRCNVNLVKVKLPVGRLHAGETFTQ